MEYLLLGHVYGSFGLDGTLKIISSTQFGSARYKKGAKIFLVAPGSDEKQELTVVSYRNNGQFDFVRAEEIISKEDADSKKRCEVLCVKDDSVLKEGYYFYGDLEGCEVVDQTGNILGIVSKVEEFPAQLTLRVKRRNGKDFFVPFMNQFVTDVDIIKKRIVIQVIEGML